MKNPPALLRLFITSLAMLLLFGALSLRASAAELLDRTPRIAVASAFEPEWTVLKSELREPTEHMINGRSFITGKLAGRDVVLFLSGISMVNAAMNTQIALDRFSLSAIVFSGIAGGVDPTLNIGFAIPPWMEKGDFAAYGMMFPRPIGVTREGGALENRFWFASDKSLLAVARRVAGKVALAGCADEKTCLSHKPKIIVGGNGVSGQAFVDNAKFREYVSATFHATVLDMESAAVAHVAYANGVPFLAVRSLSDLAGGGSGANEVMTFFALASRNSAMVVEAILREMP
jgi:adenosylhomocysteine nucleosidase